MNVLVLAAHPDDEVLGCGGTIARLSSEGHKVTIAILGQGVASRYTTDRVDINEEIERLRTKSREAARILGVDSVRHYDLPDNRFDSIDLLDVVKLVEEVGRQISPDEVYTQHGGDLNIDHNVTFRAAMTAFRPTPENHLRALYTYEVASSTEWAFSKFKPTFTPDTFWDISDYLDIKIKALSIYNTEMREFPHPRSIVAIRNQAAERGARVGMPIAEAFQTVWRRV